MIFIDMYMFCRVGRKHIDESVVPRPKIKFMFSLRFWEFNIIKRLSIRTTYTFYKLVNHGKIS